MFLPGGSHGQRSLVIGWLVTEEDWLQSMGLQRYKGLDTTEQLTCVHVRARARAHTHTHTHTGVCHEEVGGSTDISCC